MVRQSVLIVSSASWRGRAAEVQLRLLPPVAVSVWPPVGPTAAESVHSCLSRSAALKAEGEREDKKGGRRGREERREGGEEGRGRRERGRRRREGEEGWGEEGGRRGGREERNGGEGGREGGEGGREKRDGEKREGGGDGGREEGGKRGRRRKRCLIKKLNSNISDSTDSKISTCA